MASAAEDVYFPSLERCLKDEFLLLSWQDVFSAVLASGDELAPGVQRFLEDDQTHNLLKRPLKPYDAPSTGTKAAFDHLTAAINITPDDSATYNLTELKEDALWLSQVVQVDEVAALRIAVLEWQKQPCGNLLARPLEAELDIGAFDDGVSSSESIFAQVVAGSNNAEGPSTSTGHATNQRRTRLALLYQSERAYVLATARLILSNFNRWGDDMRLDFAPLRNLVDPLTDSFLSQAPKDGSAFIRQAVESLEAFLAAADSMVEVIVDLDEHSPAASRFHDHLVLQIISTLELIVLVSASSDKILSSDAVEPFFRLMLNTGYLRPIIASALQTAPTMGRVLQLVLSAASLAVLKLPEVVAFLAVNYDDEAVLEAPETRGYYICTPSCLATLQNSFLILAENRVDTAALAMMAWVVITSLLGDFAAASGLLSSEDDEEEISPLIQMDHWRTRALNQGFLEITGAAKSFAEALRVLAHSATVDLSVFTQIVTVMAAIERHFGTNAQQAFAVIIQESMYSLFRLSEPFVQYSSDTLVALLATLGGETSYWQFAARSGEDSESLADLLAGGMTESPPEYVGELRYRYPREMGPFHQFYRAMLANCSLQEDKVQGLMEQLLHANTFLLKLPSGFNAYREDPSSVDPGSDDVPYQLLADLPFFLSSRDQGSAYHFALPQGTGDSDSDESHENSLAAGSLGTLVASGRPPVLCFLKDYSPLRYMIGCLCTVIPGNDIVEVSSGSPVADEDILDIVGLLSTAVLAVHRAGVSSIGSILDETFIEAEPNRNLLEVIAELFESQLTALQGSADNGSIDMLVQCMQFFHAVAVTQPNRLWPILARSRLLEIDGRGGSLSSIVSSVEMVIGRYDFLRSSIHLFEALIHASLWSGSATPSGRALTRFSERKTARAGAEALPQRMASIVMTSFTRALLEVFVNSRAWRYSSADEKANISSQIVSTLDSIMCYAYGCDDEPNLHQKAVVSVLADSATLIADVFLSSSTPHSPAVTIIDMISNTLDAVGSPEFQIFGEASKAQCLNALKISRTAISVRVARGESMSDLEKQIGAASPIYARLYAGYHGFKAPVAGLIERLINAPSMNSMEAPTLLGTLCPNSAKDFLATIGQLDRPLNRTIVEKDLWRMLSTVVSSKQHWLAISLLTGNIPKDRARLKKKDQRQSRTKSLFSYAVNRLSEVKLEAGRPIWRSLPQELALELLQFVASCQNHWSWAASELRNQPKFLDAITEDYIRHLHRESSDTTANIINETAIAGVIAQILSMHIYSSAQLGDKGLAGKITAHLQYYERFGISAPRYSISLHANLKSNLEKQHKGLRLDNFKHTLTFPTRFGTNYFYDIPFASQVINIRRSVTSRNLRGLEQHLKEANEDLSLVEAQISLLKGWKLLATELAKTAAPDTPLSSLLIDLATKCLKENASSTLPQTIFERLRFHRIELALNVLQRLVVLDFKDKDQVEQLKTIYSTCWDTIRTTGFNFDTVFSDDDVLYYRGLLQILFLTLTSLTRPTPGGKSDLNSHPPRQANELVEVLVYVIIKGFKSLTSALHNGVAPVTPSDFALLTAMLQMMLKIPGIDLLFSQMTLHFANNSASSHATSLFSWADQFLIDGDPVYGELAVLFLLELSSIPSVAEILAVDGVLSQLSSAKIMRLYTRPRGMGPFDNPHRLHSIWSRGILPLCLNLLDAVGAPVAAEVVSFLNTFSTQLHRLCAELANRSSTVGTRPADSHLTLSIAAEAHSISLLWLVVERYRAAGAAAGALATDIPSLDIDKAALKDDIDDFVKGRSNISSLVVPGNEREADLMRLKPLSADSTVSNRLEERVMAELVAASECFGGMGNGM